MGNPSVVQFAQDPALLGLTLWPKQVEILIEMFQPGRGVSVLALGRRSGKTLMAAIAASYCATFMADKYKNHLRRGERFHIISVANTIDQARLALTNVKDLITGSPLLSRMIVRNTDTELELSNGAVFKALPASSRSGRGMAAPVVIFDELGHALDTSGNAAGDSLYQALAPSVAQFGELGKIFMLSSPWLQSGIFYDTYQQAIAGTYPHLWAANYPTWEVNPTIPASFYETERSRDPVLFDVEYGANFSQSLSAFLSHDLIDSCVNRDRDLLPPNPRYRGQYLLSLDPAKGNRDQYTACIAHQEEELLVIDRFHEFAAGAIAVRKKQVSVAEVEQWIIDMDQLYGFKQISLDQYNSQATIQRLMGAVPIQELTWTQASKTTAYSKLRQMFTGGAIELYPHKDAVRQLKGLIVQYRPNGSWNVTGGTGAAVDDYCSALAGVALMTRTQSESGPELELVSIPEREELLDNLDEYRESLFHPAGIFYGY